jgi:thioredoxin family protein/cytochrome c biogenesis DsbD-like protein
MVELIGVGIVAGFLAGISPCILPVLPVVLVAGASRPTSDQTPAGVPRADLARSLAVIGGLVLSFSIVVLAGSEILSLLHLPQDALRDAGIVLLVVVGLGYLIPPLGALIERPFARLGTRRPSGRAGGFVLGLAVGVVYVPCAGPVGEGGYATTGQLIRQLLQAAHPSLTVPTPTGVPDKTPTGELSPETYIGYEELQYLDPPDVTRDAPAVYHFPSSLPLGALGLAGTWTDHAQEATAGNGAELELGFLAKDVYLVLGGNGTLDVSVNGHHTQTIDVSGIPRLYTLFQAGSATTGTLLLHASPGVQAYDFTFG